MFAATALAWIVLELFAASVDVVTAWPEPADNSVGDEIAVEQPLSLYSVTVAASDKVMVTVGVKLVPGDVGEMDANVMVGADV